MYYPSKTFFSEFLLNPAEVVWIKLNLVWTQNGFSKFAWNYTETCLKNFNICGVADTTTDARVTALNWLDWDFNAQVAFLQHAN